MAEIGAHLSGVWATATDLQIERGVGCHVVDVNGHEYLDFTAGLGAASTGYAHPKVTAAIAEQAGRIIHSQINVYRHDKLEPLANKLAEITPEGIDTFYFGSTSDEIVEAAVKLAKHATDRRNVISFDGAFHGRTHYALAMSSSRVIDRAGYGPLPGGVFIAPFPDPHASDQEREVSRALRGLDRIMSTQVAAEKVAAFVIEPVIGERGYIPTPKGLHGGTGSALRRARHPAHRRRDPERVRADRQDVRSRSARRPARHHLHGQGHRLGVSVRCARHAASVRRAMGDRQPQRLVERQSDRLCRCARHDRSAPGARASSTT